MSVRQFLSTVFEEISAADAQGMHYALAALATLVLIVRYAVWQHFDIAYGTFILTFWGTAIAGEKVNSVPNSTPGSSDGTH